MRAVDAVILDLGNVLVFHDNDLLMRRLAERAGAGVQVVARAISAEPLFAGTNRGLLDRVAMRRAICEAIGTDIPEPEFTALWSCHFSVHDAVLPLVEALVGRVSLVLLSNTNVLHMDYLRPRLPLLERFDHLLLSYECGLVKPEPAFYEEALRRAGVPAHRAAFFDDVQRFVDAACVLGIQGRLFTDAPTFETQLAALGLAP